MATTARFTAQMIVLGTPETVGEINAFSVKSNIQKSVLLRRALLESGWPAVRRELISEYGSLTTAERRYGTLAALPPAERAAYAIKHRLDWNNPLCQVSRDGRGRPMQRPADADVALSTAE
jgi:hypothetical protein